MTHINELPLEVIRMILQQLYNAYCQEGSTTWSFSDAMKVHPIWQSLGNDIIYQEISRIMNQRRQSNEGPKIQCNRSTTLRNQKLSIVVPRKSIVMQHYLSDQRRVY